MSRRRHGLGVRVPTSKDILHTAKIRKESQTFSTIMRYKVLGEEDQSSAIRRAFVDGYNEHRKALSFLTNAELDYLEKWEHTIRTS